MTPLPPVARLASLALVLPVLLLAGCSEGSGATSLQIDFAGQKDAVDTEVGFAPEERPAATHYERDGIPHPDAYTAHDQLEAWSKKAGKTYAITLYQDTGFGAGYFVTAIDGVAADGTTAYWSLSINGQPSDVGMSQAVLHEGDVVAWTFTSASGHGAASGLDPDPLGVTIDQVPATRNETATITGSVDQAATISIDGGTSIDVQAGRWSLTSPPLQVGQRLVTLRIEDGVHSIVRDLVLVRLASATMTAVFTASPGHDDLTHEVWYDPHTLSSASMYEGTDTERATTYSVHDLMVDWTTQTGTPIVYSGPGAFGFGVERIDGIGQPLDSSLPPYWCYTLNGDSADLGISLQTVLPGDVIVWEYSTCV